MNKLALLTISGAFLFAGSALAQVPAGAPAGTTGICKDGTYSSAASKSGACSGHKGVQTWYSTAAPAPAAAMKAAPAAVSPAPAAMKSAPEPAAMKSAPAAAPSSTAMAAGGGAGQVWVNTKSKVYHCQGDRYYGKTKAGSYMTEAAAVSAGNHADHGKACH
jgi:hypothetical protein